MHPEVSFKWLARKPMTFPKTCQAGLAERLKALKDVFPDIMEQAVEAPVGEGARSEARGS